MPWVAEKTVPSHFGTQKTKQRRQHKNVVNHSTVKKKEINGRKKQGDLVGGGKIDTHHVSQE